MNSTMTEKTIQKALLRKFDSHIYKFCNTYFFKNESDFLSFLSSGFCYEFEIKISRSDFKADFKKERHIIHSSNSSKSKTFLRKTNDHFDRFPSWEYCRLFPELITSREYFSYEGRGENYKQVAKIDFLFQVSSGIDFIPTEKKMIPNKFFYAVPEGMVSINEIPDYAGLIYIDELGRAKKIKDAKFLHKETLDPTILFNKMYQSYSKYLWENLK